MDAMALPPVFVGVMDWQTIKWIVEHTPPFDWFLFYGMRWFALSIFFAALFSILKTLFGHPRDDDDEKPL